MVSFYSLFLLLRNATHALDYKIKDELQLDSKRSLIRSSQFWILKICAKFQILKLSLNGKKITF